MLHAILFTCGLLAVGLLLRANVGLLRTLYVPASVVAGVIGFAVVQAGLRSAPTAGAATAIYDELRGWPTPLIALVFAGLLLEKPAARGFGDALRRGARSGALAWIIILGQVAIGLTVYLALVRPANPDVHPSFGQLLEVSWAGGHGASTAMGKLYEGFGFPAGRDLALFLATVGLVYGVVSGLVFVNVAVRRGWTGGGGGDRGSVRTITGFEPRRDSPPIAFAKTRGEVLEPMALQVIILAAAFGAGYGLQQLFASGAERLLVDHPQALKATQNLPLFLFTLLGGLTVRHAMVLLRVHDLIDPASVQRLLGVAMEFLIVAAVASMRIDAIGAYLAPVVALVVLAAAWSAFCLLVLARRLLPPAYWFELGLLNYGFSTANTPQGFMLLRVVDPKLQSGAAEDYAVAAPLSAPFVGGGIVTFVALPLLLSAVGAGWVLAGCVVLAATLYVVARVVFHR